MALLDISLVSQALQTLIARNVTQSPAWPAGQTLNVSLMPPDALNGDRTIGLYLYHIMEAAHTKSQDWPAAADVPLRYSPMGLTLFYMLTAHSDIADEAQRMFAEQRMMGLAIKTLHDYPSLTDVTMIGGLPVFPDTPQRPMRGHDNRVRVGLQPIQFNEAMHYWTAGSKPLRLAAYYEVSANLLEPDPVTSKRSRVLTYGVYSMTRGAPRLDGSRNTITFTIPNDTSPHEVELQPAEVTYLSDVVFFGSDVGGDRTSLVLYNRRWTDPLEVDAPWALTVAEGAVTVTVQAKIGTQDVLPGIYGAVVRTTNYKTLPNGETRAFVSESNQTPFTITPTVNPPATLAATAVGTVNGKNFDPAVLTDDAVQVFVGQTRLDRTTAGIPAAGKFRVISPTQLRFRLPASAVAGDTLPFRLLIDGAECAPHWIVVT